MGLKVLKKYFVRRNESSDIEAEEIFLDSEAIRSLERKGKLEKPISALNFIIFFILIVFSLSILFVRTGYLQIIKGSYYQDLAQGNKLRIYPVIPPRGVIYDRNGELLLYNIPGFDLIIDLNDFLDNSSTKQKEILAEIADIAQKDAKDLQQEIKNAQGKSSLTLLKGFVRDQALILESKVAQWPGVRIAEKGKRYYVNGLAFSHLLGYTGKVNQNDLENYEGYFLEDEIGKAGLEKEYEEILRGIPGQEQFEVDSSGQNRKLLAFEPPQEGNSLILSIDKKLQEKTYQALEDQIKKINQEGNRAKKATVLIANPQNGQILTMVSLPTFDNNLFAQGISSADLNLLKENPDRPFLNRNVAGQYPPGSTLKPLIASAALEENIIKASKTINCQGEIIIPNKYNPNIIYHYPDWKAHGLTNMVKAIAESCNVYFYTIGGGFAQFEGLGLPKIKEYLQLFGLGEKTNIDLPQEEAGLIPDEEWKEQNKGEEWVLGDTYHLSIGQGDVLVTPLQLTMAISAIANNGTLFQPQLIDKIVDSQQNIVENISSKIKRDNFLAKDNLAVIQKGMREAVLSGSAKSLSSLNVKVAGKTGTAQFGSEDKTHAWFVGYAPIDNPKIAITVLVEGGGEGYQAAVPVAKEILKWYFN